MKDTIYFRHDFNAHADPKMIKLRMKYWWEWYWIFWWTLEYMRNDTDVSLSYYDIDTFVYQMYYDIEKYKEILQYCVQLNLLLYDEEDKVYYSKRLQEDVSYMKEKSDKARDAVNARWEKRYERNTNVIPNSIVKYMIVKKDNVEEVKKLYKEIIGVEEVEKYPHKYWTLFELMQTWYKVKQSKEDIEKKLVVVSEYVVLNGVVWIDWSPLREQAMWFAKKMRLWCEENNKITQKHMSRFSKFLSDYKKPNGFTNK